MHNFIGKFILSYLYFNICLFLKPFRMNTFELTETFYIIMCNLFNIGCISNNDTAASYDMEPYVFFLNYTFFAKFQL